MRTLAVLLLFAGSLVAIQAAPEDTKPLTPVEAIKNG
jgi:hypothetical protein